MHAKFHGVTSLLLESLAIVIGFIAIWQANRIAGGFYAVLVLIAVPLMLYAYCAKCDIRLTDCRHVLPGQVTRLLPDRDNAPYTIRDYLGLGLAVIVLVVFPQPWLLDNIPAFILFWACLVAGLVQILMKVCKGCGNQKCIMCDICN
jgi:hypothetical protein